MKAKPIRDIIKRSIVDEGRGTIEVDDGHFFSDLINDDDKHSKRRLTTFLLLMVATIVCIVTIISSLIFFVNEVLLYSNTPTVNQGGSTVLGRSCERESMLFLLNSSERWAATGISLQKGDKFRISYSGGFFSDIHNKIEAARLNKKPKYGLKTFSRRSTIQDIEKRNLTLYKRDDSRFGSLLYSIASENGVDAENDLIFQIAQEVEWVRRVRERLNKIEFVRNHPNLSQWIKSPTGMSTAKKGGKLYLSVNDIPLTDSVINLYERKNRNTLKLDSIIRMSQFKILKDSIELYLMKGDSIWLYGTTFTNHFQQNRDAFFNDNLGEALVLVEIDRKVPFFGRTSWYRWTEKHFNSIWDSSIICPIKIVLSIVFFVIAAIWLIVVKLCWITIPLACLVFFTKQKRIKKESAAP